MVSAICRTCVVSFCVLVLHTAAVAQERSVPFQVAGAGEVFDFKPTADGLNITFRAVGIASFVGPYQTSPNTLTAFGFPDPEETTTLPFASVGGEPILFNGVAGTLAFTYDKSEDGQVTLFPVGGGDFIALFIAKFEPAPQSSTGVYTRFIGGSFIMYAISEPFNPLADESAGYIWFGRGPLIISREE